MADKLSIDDFRAVLKGGGVRPTMFEVLLTFPRGTVNAEKDVGDQSKFLVKASQLPASVVGNIDVPFRGRKFKVAGDRTFEDWTITVTNDVSFALRAGFEKWSELVQNHNFALGANKVNQYMADANVTQLDRQGDQLRNYLFEGIWPTNVGEITLDMDTNDTIEEYEVTFAVQYWAAAKNGEAVARSNPADPRETPKNAIKT